MPVPMLLPSLRRVIAAAVLLLVALDAVRGQTRPDPSLVTVERIYNSRDFRGQGFGPVRWLDDSTYTAVEPVPGGTGTQLVRVDAATGRKSVMVEAATLLPVGAKEPVEIEDYDWSTDHARLLIFTNSARVWRANTRGDFWVLDLATKALHQLGGAAAKKAPSTLQFAKFSPDGRRVAYVREHNIYVEPADGAGRSITALTVDG